MKTLFAVTLLGLAACHSPTAPAEKPCVPDFNNADSSMTIPSQSTGGDTVYVIRIAWCGPITVN